MSSGFTDKESLIGYFNSVLTSSEDLAGYMKAYLERHKFLLSPFNTLMDICAITEPYVSSFLSNGEFYKHSSGVIVGELYTYDQFVETYKVNLDKEWMETVLIKRIYFLFESCRCLPNLPENNHTVPSVGLIENVLKTVVNRIYGDATGDRDYGRTNKGSHNRSIKAYPEILEIIRDIFIRIVITGDSLLLFPFTYAIYGMSRMPNAFGVNPKHFKLVKKAEHLPKK